VTARIVSFRFGLAIMLEGPDPITCGPGMSDPDVLAWATRDERILLTFDKDFGELAGASALPSTCGIMLFRDHAAGRVTFRAGT